ncbi:MAG TPA: glycoside hydrolase family 172 protein [Candidatus Lokiarchaeia archaeon]|nr:glycoside hydrolase family 172 protein [Candidatus Lokiarchaeia archaeon]
MPIGSTSLRDLAKPKDFIRRRESSFDRTGGNEDFYRIGPGEKRVIFDVTGVAGIINHLWNTLISFTWHGLRGIIIRIWWDDDPEDSPSVETPLGDFFGVAWGGRPEMVSLPIQRSVRAGKSMNCWWPMPFNKAAKFEIENLNKHTLVFYFYVDWEEHAQGLDSGEELLYFHAHYRQQDFQRRTVDRDTGKRLHGAAWQGTDGKNTLANGGYKENYTILEAEGRGHYVGVTLGIRRGRASLLAPLGWPGEGDDMIWIDTGGEGEPQLYGTGTEDYFCTAFSPWAPHSTPYYGVSLGGGFNWAGRISYYRFHVEDPVTFTKDIKVTIEHGHDNHYGGRWCSCAFWYQTEPHAPQAALPSYNDLLPPGTIRGKVITTSIIVILLVIVLTWLHVIPWLL